MCACVCVCVCVCVHSFLLGGLGSVWIKLGQRKHLFDGCSPTQTLPQLPPPPNLPPVGLNLNPNNLNKLNKLNNLNYPNKLPHPEPQLAPPPNPPPVALSPPFWKPLFWKKKIKTYFRVSKRVGSSSQPTTSCPLSTSVVMLLLSLRIAVEGRNH